MQFKFKKRKLSFFLEKQIKLFLFLLAVIIVYNLFFSVNKHLSYDYLLLGLQHSSTFNVNLLYKKIKMVKLIGPLGADPKIRSLEMGVRLQPHYQLVL
ncbi:MAG: hypothetical protein CM15mP83_2850 [Flavobacteriaceae bacterium]|nr:MAG: hypothetical protein CM15mP83_2850 [Flavobacteriaceae bacterium]